MSPLNSLDRVGIPQPKMVFHPTWFMLKKIDSTVSDLNQYAVTSDPQVKVPSISTQNF